MKYWKLYIATIVATISIFNLVTAQSFSAISLLWIIGAASPLPFLHYEK